MTLADFTREVSPSAIVFLESFGGLAGGGIWRRRILQDFQHTASVPFRKYQRHLLFRKTQIIDCNHFGSPDSILVFSYGLEDYSCVCEFRYANATLLVRNSNEPCHDMHPNRCNPLRSLTLPARQIAYRPGAERGMITSMADIKLGPISWERMIRAVEKVRERLQRATRALEAAGIPYGVIGGNAVAAWVSRVDESAVRNTQDVDILIDRKDLEAAKTALAAVGFIYRHSAGIDFFLDGPGARARDAVHVIFGKEKVRREYAFAAPDVAETEQDKEFRVLTLDALLRMKLTSFRRKDQVHVLDLIGVGLVDASWVPRLPAELAARLQELLDNPEG